MTVYDIISCKRDGQELTQQQIEFLIRGLTRNEIPDYQLSAWLMAVFINGMSESEKWFLTNAMLHSGQVVDLTEISGPKIDKHSTGGVGDKTSIILAPIVAAAGVSVPMISGRGLGHTGGTLDKLQSIPGFRIDYTIDEFKKSIKEIGLCLIGQTSEIAPADKKLYALRDVTATIQSIPLISASIMSKKLAEGINGLVLDVKTGSGAFMNSYDNAVDLAKSLVGIGRDSNVHTVTYITNMDEPLGNAVGNWLEIKECIDALQGKGPEDLMKLTHQLSGTMIWLGQKAESIEHGVEISENMINSGKAWQKFLQLVERQEGSVDMVKNPESYPQAKNFKDIVASEHGYINKIDTLEVGLASVALGAGRLQQEDIIDPAAGILLHKKTGDKVNAGDKLITIFSERPDNLDEICDRLLAAIQIQTKAPVPAQLIYDSIDSKKL